MTRDEAINLLDNLLGMVEDNHGSNYDMAIHMAIDALKQPEIIRCKECKHYYEDEDEFGIVDGWCWIWAGYCASDEFCSLAKREQP